MTAPTTRWALGAWLALAGCGLSTARPDRPGAEEGGTPSVLVVTSSAPCPGGAATALEAFVSEDESRLQDAFGAGLEPTLRDPTEAALLDRLRRRRRPVVVFYSGAGRSVARGDGSELCLRKGTPSIEALARAIPHEARWAVLIVNACESADVDVSRIALPISVISASPNLVAARFGAARRSSFADAVAAVIRQRADPNGDGILSDQELYATVAGQLDSNLTVTQTPRAPIVKLRRQAPSHLPIALLGAPSNAAGADPLPPGLDRALADALAAGRPLADGRSWTLPAFDQRYVVLASDLASLGPRFPPGTCAFAGDRTAAERIAGRTLGLELFSIERLDDDNVQRVPLPGGDPILRSASDSGSWLAATEAALPCAAEVLPGTDPPVARFRGPVLGDCFEVAGQRLPRESMRATPCPSVGDGQCFELAVAPPGRRDPRVCACAAPGRT